MKPFFPDCCPKAKPWDSDNDVLDNELQACVPHDGIAAGVVQPTQPGPDELLCGIGLDREAVVAWCEGGAEADPMLTAAMQHGICISTAGPDGEQPTSPLAAGKHAVMHAFPECALDKRWWWVLMTRSDEPFNEKEQRLTGMMLRRWMIQFNTIEERGMHRILVGHDDRLLIADLCTQAILLHQPTFARDLVNALRPVIKQRYPDLHFGDIYDVALPHEHGQHWVRFSKRIGFEHARGEHWLIEAHPLDEQDLPPVGVVPDARIAAALAYIHESYAKSPALAEIAVQAHMSPFHFHRLFSKQVGVSPKQYLQRKQLQVAKWKLRSSRTPIGEIASDTGFSSHGHFTSTFHRIVGLSPSDYREQA